MKNIVLLYLVIGTVILQLLRFGNDSKIAYYLIFIPNICMAIYILLTNILKAIRSRKFFVRKTQFLFLSFFLYLTFTTIIAAFSNPEYDNLQLQALFAAFIWCSPFFTVYHICSNVVSICKFVNALRITGLIVSFSVYASLIGLLLGLKLGEVMIYGGGYIRAFGFLGDQVGFLIVLFILLEMFLKSWFRFSLHLGAVFLTGTRGAFICLLVALVINTVLDIMKVVYLKKDRKPIIRKLVTIYSVSTILALLSLSTPIGSTLINRLFEKGSIADAIDSSGRGAGATLGILVLKENFFTGVGFNGFASAISKYNPEKYFSYGILLPENYTALTSNQLIQTATDGGIFAVAILVVFLFCVSVNIFRATKQAEGKLALIFEAFALWSVAIFVGNQSAVWLLPNSLNCYYVFMVAGIAERFLSLRSSYQANKTNFQEIF